MTDIKELTRKAAQLLDKCTTVTLAIGIGGSFPLPHLLTKLRSNDFDKIILSSDSDFVMNLPANSRAKLTYSDGRDFVILIGEPEVIRDFESDSEKAHTVLLRFKSEEAAICMSGDCVFLDTTPVF